MGGGSSHVYTASNFMRDVRPFREDLTPLDRRLLNSAKVAILNESGSKVDSTEVTVDFIDTDPLVITTPNHKTSLYVGYDGDFDIHVIWQHHTLWRRFKCVVVNGLRSIASAFGNALSIAANSLRMITY